MLTQSGGVCILMQHPLTGLKQISRYIIGEKEKKLKPILRNTVDKENKYILQGPRNTMTKSGGGSLHPKC